jgi:hypothetical protein
MSFNKATRVIEDALRKIGGRRAKQKWIDGYSGQAGVITKHPTDQAAVDGEGVLAIRAGMADPTMPRILTWADATVHARNIDEVNSGSAYTNVKNLSTWQHIYQVESRYITYMNPAGHLVPNFESSVPCHNCGVVLPMSFVQVDHYMPQAGSADYHVLKTLRAFGMTAMGPTGSKGLAAIAHNLGALVVNPKMRNRLFGHLKTTTTPGGKWTTNELGNAFLSLVVFAGPTAQADVSRMCRNSLLNLVPLCPQCNGIKNDQIRDIM